MNPAGRPPTSSLRATFLASCVAVAAAPSVPQDPPSGEALLLQAQARLRALPALSCRLLVRQESAGSPAQETECELWIDREGGRVRTHFRDLDRPEPYLMMVATPRGLLAWNADAEQAAQAPLALDLSAALDACLAGELWRTTWQGGLVGMKLAAYRPPTVLRDLETIAGEPCRVLSFGGNQEARLWVSTRDSLPRRLRGPLDGGIRDETVLALELPEALADSRFELQPGERPVLSYLAARTAWAHLPPQRSRWPAAGTVAPPLLVLGKQGQLEPLPAPRTPRVVAFWFSGCQAVVDELAALEQSLAAEDLDSEVELVSIHHGSDRGALERALAAAGLRHPAYLAGTGAENAFHRYHIASCPVFFVLEQDGTVRGATRRSAEVVGLVGHPPAPSNLPDPDP